MTSQVVECRHRGAFASSGIFSPESTVTGSAVTVRMYMNLFSCISSTYDHRVWKTGLPVRSAVLKPHAGQLVVWWVTTCESWLLYVFCDFFLL
ncbi:hypothetical protein N7454_001620 [Penicillium verhagenii]|nr:hypothetical protein N7454_001620 [Penicillium verhagenii]